MAGPDSTREIRGWRDEIVAAFASVMFLGYSPAASGTVASLPAIGVAVLLRDHQLALLILAVALFIVAIPASTRAEEIYGRKDPGRVTIDEFVGMLIAFLWLPITWSSVVAVFVLFRLFDIVKPFPADRCERLGGGLGIMTDDIVAAVYANVAFRILMLIF